MSVEERMVWVKSEESIDGEVDALVARLDVVGVVGRLWWFGWLVYDAICALTLFGRSFGSLSF